MAFLEGFLPRASRLQGSSSRGIVHMQAGLYGGRIGTVLEGCVRRAEIGGDGEYCGENDARLGCINVSYYDASGGKYLHRALLFDLKPVMIFAVRISTRRGPTPV